jgi:isoquinoline 1-oxidoreductase alpha subunit
VIPVGTVENTPIVTIEGVSANGPTAVQKAWIAYQVPQCGYCQSGMIMAVTALLARNPKPGDDDLKAAVTNICRCGTYPRIRAAVHDLAQG